MMMAEEQIQDALSHILTYHCSGNWEIVKEFYGDEVAGKINFLQTLPYQEVYDKGDVKECNAVYHLSVIQRALITALFDMEVHDEAFTTWLYLDYIGNKLFDKATGKNEHLWIN